MPVATATPDPPDPQDITELVGQHTALIRSGAGMRGICPFCGSSAFHCRPAHNTYHCYGCGDGGGPHMFTTKIDRP
ncbi:CHC2 zinc finger domain-containing protein [Pseudonocardia eucalypti]